MTLRPRHGSSPFLHVAYGIACHEHDIVNLSRHMSAI